MLPGPVIRGAEFPPDQAAIRSVIESAFGQSEEADLVEALYSEQAVLVSLVADFDEAPCAGHILFSRMWIDVPGSAPIAAAALAPVAVAPACQNRGIGSALIRAGLEACAAMGERIVIVLGHRDYYPRFGFSAELARPLESPFDPEHFMALELQPGALEGVRGRVRYANAFGIG